jgi:hypothetical protein
MRGPKDVVRAVRLDHPGLILFEALLTERDFPLITRLKRDKNILEPEEYYLIGCHFAERPFAEREFGGEVLRWLIQTFPDDSSATAAEHKLHMEGFAPPPRPRKRRVVSKRTGAAKKTTTQGKKKAKKKAKATKVPKRGKKTVKKAQAVSKKTTRKTAKKKKKVVARKKKTSAKKTSKKVAKKKTPRRK